MEAQIAPRHAKGVIATCLTLDRDAYELLKALAPTGKAYGRFLSRLVYEHAARLEERQRLQERVAAAIGAG
jgi:hypothetical protein